jgi:hypothetical protein
VPAITYDDFGGGLDRRSNIAQSRANLLWVLRNAYITTGKAVQKRPCLEHVATLESGTIGLKAFGGKLNTFYGTGAAITHANTTFVARRVPHWTSGAAPTKIHYCDHFNGLMYVAAEYAGSVFRHHYLDDPGAWAAATNYALGDFRRPTTANGFRYEVTADAGSSHATTEPTWPTTVGATVVDSGITWTCRTFAVTDANCPHTKQVAKQAQKMFAGNSTTVRYSKTGDPRDWTTASDAGFIAAGLYAQGSNEVTAIAAFSKSSIAIFFADNAQVWQVDPDPELIELTEGIESVGTLYHRASGSVQKDLIFLAQNGFRSIGLIALTDNVQDSDVGSPIDKLVKAAFATSDDPLTVYYPKLGQLWAINDDEAYVYSYSKTSKLSAWSIYDFPFTIDDATVLNQELYVRTGDDVYKVSEAVYKDGVSDIPLVDIQMYYQDAKLPGVLKLFSGMDFMGEGTPTISHKFNGADDSLETDEATFPENTEPGDLYPVELSATRIAPHVQHQLDEDFRMDSLHLYYEKLGPV